jgi:hypothetical protein
MDSLYYICSGACHFVKRTVYIVVTLVIELAYAFVADLVRKVNTLTNSNTFRLIMDFLGVIIAVAAVIMAMLVSLTVVAIIVALILFPEKRLDNPKDPFILYSE